MQQNRKKKEGILCEAKGHKSDMKNETIAGFHRRWSNRYRIKTELKRWLHLMDALVAKMRGTRYASWSARCIIRRWRQWTRRRVALEVKIGRDRANLIHFHTVAIERVQASAEHDMIVVCRLFARLLQGEEDLDAFQHEAQRFFGRRDRHLQMLTNSVARLIHLKTEATRSVERNLPGARLVRPFLARRITTCCQKIDTPLSDDGGKKQQKDQQQVVTDTITLSTYIQSQQQTDIEDLCSALKRTLVGSMATGTFHNMCFVYSGKVQTYREIRGTLEAQRSKEAQHSDYEEISSDSRTEDPENASQSSIMTKDSWM